MVAAFNEERTVFGVVSELRNVVSHIVVVDDGSRDATCEEATRAGAVVVRHLINRGQGAALQTGITYALGRGAEIVVTFDADGQHAAQDIPALVDPILRGEVDVCLGSRFLGTTEGMPAGRRWILRAAVLWTRATSGMKLTDAHNGLRAFSRRAAERLDLRLDRMAHASELIDQVRSSGLAYREVPVTIRYTDYSLAKGQRSTAMVRVAIDYLIGKVLR
jgi:glycosyltransferase involved in cell wall biosynthesis